MATAPTYFIKQVDVGGHAHELAAKYLMDKNSGFHEWEDIEQLISVGFKIEVLSELPPANAENYSLYHNAIVFIPSSEAQAGTHIEYVILRTGVEGSYSYRWEQIGSTKIDLSNYVTKGTYTGAATVSYSKANAATNEAGAITVSGSQFGFSGTAATLKTNFTPEGTITVNPTAAATISINNVTGAALAAAPAFTGTTATITVSGQAGVSAEPIEYAPAGSVSITGGGHSHSIGSSTTSVVGSVSLSSDGSAVLTGTKTFVTSASFSSNGSVSLTESGTAKATLPIVEGVSINNGSAGLTGTTSFVKSATLSNNSDVMRSPTVTNGVLSWTLSSVGISAPTGSVGITYTNPTLSVTSKTLGVSYSAPVMSAPTASVGISYSAPVLSSTPATVVSSVNANTGNKTPTMTGSFTGTSATINVTINNPTVSFTGSYQPAGSVSKPAVNLTSSAKTVATEGIKSLAPTFSGSAGSISINYTPAGSITGSQAIPAHTHAIGSTTASASGSCSITL